MRKWRSQGKRDSRNGLFLPNFLKGQDRAWVTVLSRCYREQWVPGRTLHSLISQTVGGNSLRCPDRCLGHRNMAITCHGQGENSHARRLPWTREMGRGGPRGSEVPLRSLAAFPCCPLQRSLRAECLGPWSSEQSTPVVSRKSPFT